MMRERVIGPSYMLCLMARTCGTNHDMTKHEDGHDVVETKTKHEGVADRDTQVLLPELKDSHPRLHNISTVSSWPISQPCLQNRTIDITLKAVDL
jgi:hypothetical protein